MATITTLTSLTAPKSEQRELCIICESRPYDLICRCGDKFDFNCIQHHVEQIGFEFQDNYQQASEKLVQLNDLKQKENNDYDASRTIINTWKRKRTQDINDIADKALNDIQKQENTFNDVTTFQEIHQQLSNEFHHVVHDNLNIVIQLHREINDKIENYQNLSTVMHDDSSLDAAMQSKLNPVLLNTTLSLSPPPSTLSSLDMNNHNSTTTEIEQPISLATIERTETTTNEIGHTEPTVELTNTAVANEITTRETENTTNDEFDAGQTRFIQRVNPILIPTNNDQYAATICCHNNQLIYNDFDRTSRTSRLTFIRDITNPTTKLNIDWNESDTIINADDDEWIQDIIYSDKLSGYLILNRARVRIFNSETHQLEEFQTFTDRSMKRLSCNDRYIYLTSTHSTAPNNGDEIILINYDKEEQLCKKLREIIPSRINRGAGPLVGEISDIAVGTNEQVIIGYRLERRHEVGVCLFNVTNDGKEWSCVKQLLLNECWHNNLSYTPRIDWCEKLNVFILIEYMTGHLIMIDREGQVEGECRFMDVKNLHESPINLTISSNDWFCVRYESSINIHKITS